MTEKKEKILAHALELFANEGYTATSTSKIAKAAGVSEGLIFRHFENKKGLLNAIMQDADQRISILFVPILTDENPKSVLQKTIELPFSIQESEYNFWRLNFKLKWEVAYNNPEKMRPLLEKLTWAFSQLNYENPEFEAMHMNQTIEIVSSEILKGNLIQQTAYKSFLFSKYQL